MSADADPTAGVDSGFVIASVIFSSTAFILAICFAISLYFESRIPPVAVAGSSGRMGLDWYCRRIGFAQSIVCTVYGVDLSSSVGIYSKGVSWVLTSTATSILFAFGVCWVWIHSLVVYRQIKRPYPHYLLHVLVAIPAFNWIGQCSSFIAGAVLDREYLNSLGRLVFCASCLVLMIATAGVAIALRLELTRFINSLQQPHLHPLSPKAGTGNGAAAAAGGVGTGAATGTGPLFVTKPASTSANAPGSARVTVTGEHDATVLARADDQPPASTGASARPPPLVVAVDVSPGVSPRSPVAASSPTGGGGGMTINLEPIKAAVRTLSFVATFLLFAGGYSVVETLGVVLSSQYGIANTSATHKLPPTKYDASGDLTNIFIWLVIMLKLFYVWPIYRPIAKLHGYHSQIAGAGGGGGTGTGAVVRSPVGSQVGVMSIKPSNRSAGGAALAVNTAAPATNTLSPIMSPVARSHTIGAAATAAAPPLSPDSLPGTIAGVESTPVPVPFEPPRSAE